jgi:nitroimidazol reductase NimA-like FMN-containing flavoprotein (pyridoxamine 5'-phosphate oxidase superfamily)
MDEVVRYDDWASVIVFGHCTELADAPPEDERTPARHSDESELSDAPGQDPERLLAYQVLQKHACWWEPAATARAASFHRHPTAPVQPVFYRIEIDQITGHRATPVAVWAAAGTAYR